MIKNITGGAGIQVDNGSYGFPYIPTNPNNPIQGMIRVNGNDLQTFDGSSWINLGGAYPSVSLNGITQSAIDWAHKKMQQEREIEQLAKTHPGVADLVEKMKLAEDQLNAFVALAKEDNT